MVLAFRRRSGFLTVFILAGISAIESQQSGDPTVSLTNVSGEKSRVLPQILSIWEQKKPEYAGTDLQMHAIVLSKDENTKFFWYFSKSFVSDETNLGTLINQTLSESRLETLPSSGVSWLKWKVVLNLKNLSVADSGSYWCQAENILGTVQRQTSLKVTTRPITPSPSGSTVSLTSISSESEAVTQTSIGWTDRIRYPVAVIAVPVGVVVLLIIASGLFYWQMKKGRASSSATMKSRRNIGSLQAKYVVQSNEYVIVPDLKGLGNDFGTN